MSKLKPIPNFPGYLASPWGFIYSGKLGNRKRLPGYPTHKGRLRVVLYKDGKRHQILISRLIALTFIPNPYKLPNVLHGDNNPLNNRVSNLRWGTQSENIQQMYDDGRGIKRFSYTTQQEEEVIFKFKTGNYTQQGLGKVMGLSRMSIRRILTKHNLLCQN